MGCTACVRRWFAVASAVRPKSATVGGLFLSNQLGKPPGKDVVFNFHDATSGDSPQAVRAFRVTRTANAVWNREGHRGTRYVVDTTTSEPSVIDCLDGSRLDVAELVEKFSHLLR